MKNIILILLLTMTLMLGATACGQTGQTTGPIAAPTITATQAQTSANTASHSLGQTREVEGVKITLNQVTESSGNATHTPESGQVFLLLEFTILNDSAKGSTIGMIFKFSVDGSTAQDDVTATQVAAGPALQPTLAFGETMTGFVGLRAPQHWQTLEIQFTPHAVGDSAVFTVNRSDLS